MKIGAVKEPGEAYAAWPCEGKAVGKSESGGPKLDTVFVAKLDWREYLCFQNWLEFLPGLQSLF